MKFKKSGKYFEDFEIGEVFETAGRTVTEADIVNFSTFSGDFNAIHTNEEFAKTTIFKRRVAQGAAVFSILTGLLYREGFMEGTVIAFLGVNDWKFLAPVFAGDTIYGRAEVTKTHKSSKQNTGIVTFDVEVLNQKDEVIQKGTFVLMFECRPV